MGEQPDMTVMGRVPKNHRPQAIACDMDRPRPVVDPGQLPTDCTSHDDCTAGRNGRCSNLGRNYACTYDACFSDSDCNGGVCGCNAGWRSDANKCMRGNCQVNADCGPGGYCSPSFGTCGNYVGAEFYYCHTPQDECIDDEDCGQPGFQYCAFDELAKRWQCKDSHCAG